MTIHTKKGDLLDASVDAIVNTVNCVGVMGKGIALQFKKKWPKNFKDYEYACKNDLVQPGKMHIYDAGGLVKPNFIINFPTKNHWREKTKTSYIQDGLNDLVETIIRLNIKSIAIPPLGCGNGGLDWKDVKSMIVNALDEVPDVEVLLFEPHGSPKPADLVLNTEKPRMTPGRAAIVQVLSIYRRMEYGLSKLEIQKLAYFLEEAGQELSLDFVKEQYGPYSQKLKHVLHKMDGHYIKGVGDNTGESEITPLQSAIDASSLFIKESTNSNLLDKINKVEVLIEGFESPYGMELLSTVHWVVKKEKTPNNLDAVIKSIREWNDRKKSLFSDKHIEIALNKLHSHAWI